MVVATKTRMTKRTTKTRTAKAPRAGSGEMRLVVGGVDHIDGLYTPTEFGDKIARWILTNYKGGGTFSATIRGTIPASTTRLR
jgi:hypothetical protein